MTDLNLEERIKQLENENNQLLIKTLLDDLRAYRTIPHEYFAELFDRSDFLNCLEAAGVDCWEGYSHAQQMYNETEDDEFEE